MRIRHYPLFLGLTGCLAGVIAVNLVPTNEPPHALVPRGPGDVKIVSTPPGEPFAEVGFIEGEPSVKPEAVLYKMLEAAGRWGCDYLLVTNSTFSKHGPDYYGGIGYHGTCIVLRDAAKSASLAKSAPVPVDVDAGVSSWVEPNAPPASHVSGIPEVTQSGVGP